MLSIFQQFFEASDNRVGFEVSASTLYPENYPHHAYAVDYRQEWTTNEETQNFWIKIKCPVAVAIWQFHLRGRLNSIVGRIYDWRLEGSNDDINWAILYSKANTYISTTQYFKIPTTNTVDKNFYFRIYVVTAEDLFPGLTAFQIYTLDDQV